MNLRRPAVLAAFVLVSILAAQGAHAAGNSSDPKYQIAMAVVGEDRWFAIRYDVTTGKTWRMVEDKWEAMPDTGSLPAGRYEVHLLPLKNDWGGLRLEVLSGRAWQARESKWVEIGGPADTTAAPKK